MSFEGVHTPLVTPFKDDGEIDHEMLGKHAASLVGRVSGMGVGGTTGEYYALSFDERVKTFDTVASAVDSLRAYRDQLSVAVANLDKTAEQYSAVDKDGRGGVVKSGDGG